MLEKVEKILAAHGCDMARIPRFRFDPGRIAGDGGSEANDLAGGSNAEKKAPAIG